MKNNLIDSYDINTAINYILYAEKQRVHCLKPEYLMNYFTFLTKVKEHSQKDTMDIWKVFDTKTWSTIALFYIFCILFNTIIKRHVKKTNILKNLFTSIYIYYQPLINGGECRKPFNFIYLFWIISVFPLIEIFKNDMYVKLIQFKETRIDTVDELLNLNYTIFIHSSTLEFWNEIFPIDYQNELTISLNRLRSQAMTFGDMMGDWMVRLKGLPDHQIMQEFSKIAISTHEHNIRVTEEVMKRFSKAHIGSDQYLLTLITPFCYKPNFGYEKLAQKM